MQRKNFFVILLVLMLSGIPLLAVNTVHAVDYFLTVETSPSDVLVADPEAVTGEGYRASGSWAIVDAEQTVVSGLVRYEFTGWTGTEEYTGEPDAAPTLTGNQALKFMDGDATVTANYQPYYTFYLNLETIPPEVLASDSAAVSGEGYYPSGSLVLIDANPTVTSGTITYKFLHWSANDNSAADPDELADLTPTQAFIMMDGDRDVNAIYETRLGDYYLNLETDPAHILSVDPEAVTGEGWHSSGYVTFSAKTTIIDAENKVKYDFKEWTLDGYSANLGNPAEYFMDGDYTFTAAYDISFYLSITTDPPEVQATDPAAVTGEGWYPAGDFSGWVDAKQTIVSGPLRYEFKHWIGDDSDSLDEDDPQPTGNQGCRYMDSPYTMVAVYETFLDVNWENSFAGDSGGTTLKISVDDKYFQFSTPEKQYPIKQAETMIVRGNFLSIWHSDSDLIIAGVGILDPRIDFCLVIVRDVQTGQTYLVRDKIGQE